MHTDNLQQRLLSAIEEGRIKLAYQPLVCAKTYVTRRYECLLRILENDEIIPVGSFIEAVEKLGGIQLVDEAVLELVVQELLMHPRVHLTMNISNMSVAEESWLKKAQSLLRSEKIASRLVIEITETGSFCDIDRMSSFIKALKALGCRVAIDDFGTGIFSAHNIYLNQLQHLNADILKIDGKYISNIIDTPHSQVFIRKVVDFARSYEIKTVAEFVENAEIARMVQNLGVDYMQGHYFSPAINHRPWKGYTALIT